MIKFNYYIPTRIVFGCGSLEQLATLKLPGKKALIVITNGKSVRKYGYLQRVQDLLAKNGCDNVVYDKILPNPILTHVMEGAKIAKKEACDFVLGLGGGSPIDSAKSIAIMATNPGDYWDYISGGTGKAMPIPNRPLPIVAITTTAGTGTEADPWTVITHQDRQEKIGFGYDLTYPTLSIVDPELMVTVPPHLTAYQGFDALFHSCEGFIANIATPVSDGYALQAVKLVAKSLAKAVADGKDLEARTDVALANTLSGMNESTSSCTSEHSLAHATGALHPEIPHGAALIAISEEYFKFFAAKVPDRIKELAKAMGKPGNSALEFVDALVELQKQCGVYGLKLSDYGVTYDELPALVDNAYATMGGLFKLDRHTLSRDETIGIMQRAFK
ncbi:MAG: iron-containing alcohol dehydrogenase [Lentisphaerae bacterium]|jgi:alcohol dehydrogenase|nr:iron-containing alcohol dehydrogenase [Lentisphaerota bacterium]